MDVLDHRRRSQLERQPAIVWNRGHSGFRREPARADLDDVRAVRQPTGLERAVG
jgi:hypothetical protein